MTMVRDLKQALVKRKQHAEGIARQMQTGLDILATMKDDSKIRYRVQILDGLGDDIDVTVERKAPLKAAMQAATVKYKTVNKCMVVRARCHVYAVIPGVRMPITLSKDVWGSLFEKFAADETRR